MRVFKNLKKLNFKKKKNEMFSWKGDKNMKNKI